MVGGWETDRYAMQRELGYRVYLMGNGIVERGGRQKRDGQKERGWREGMNSACLRRRLGILDRACHLKRQGTQVTGKVSKMMTVTPGKVTRKC